MKIIQSVLVASLGLVATASFGQTLTYSIEPGITLVNPIIVWGTPTSTGYTGNDIVSTSNWSGTGSFTMPTSTLAAGDPYSVVSYYHDATSMEHLVFLSDAANATTLTGADFQTTFGVSEADVLTIIGLTQSGWITFNGQNLSTNSGTAALLSYFPIFGTSGTSNPLFGFSSGTQEGSVVTQAVPEPAALVVLGVAAIALIRRRTA